MIFSALNRVAVKTSVLFCGFAEEDGVDKLIFSRLHAIFFPFSLFSDARTFFGR